MGKQPMFYLLRSEMSDSWLLLPLGSGLALGGGGGVGGMGGGEWRDWGGGGAGFKKT